MAGPITAGDLGRLLEPGLRRVFGQHEPYLEAQCEMLFDTSKSTRAFEIDQQFEGLGLAQAITEGQAPDFDQASSGWAPKYTNLTYAKGYSVSKTALEDDLYGQVNKGAMWLKRGLMSTREVNAANVYIRGENTSYLQDGLDGLTLFNTAHVHGPSNSGTYSNMLATATAISETSLESMVEQIRNAVDARGHRLALMPKSIVCGNDDHFELTRILNATLQPNTNNNNPNAMKFMGMFPDGLKLNNYLTNSGTCYMRTDLKDALVFQKRIEPEFSALPALDNFNLRFVARERYVFGWTEPKGVYTNGILP